VPSPFRALFVVLLVGCGPSATGYARDIFISSTACVEAKTTSVVRVDLEKDWGEPMAGVLAESPPPNVAADPSAAAMWQDARAAQQRELARANADLEDRKAHTVVVEARGCGEDKLFVCGPYRTTQRNRTGAGTFITAAEGFRCREAVDPNTVGGNDGLSTAEHVRPKR